MSTTTIIAVDVALLLPRIFRQEAISLNRTLTNPPEGFHFNDTHLPHLTLIQQFVATDHLDAFSRVVEQLALSTERCSLEASEICTSGSCTIWQIEPTVQLVKLHRHLMQTLLPFDAKNGSPASFVSSGAPPRPTDLDWVAQYRDRAAYDHFNPHVTLGVGSLPYHRTPRTTRFMADQLAICQLGRFCTCREIIADWSLTPST